MQNGEILSNNRLQSDYYEVKFYLPEIAKKAVAGQFVHVKIDDSKDKILRRPFSIHNAQSDVISVVYKIVGHGTEKLSQLKAGTICDVMGPLGNGYTPITSSDITPVMIAGGYGSAAMYLLTEQIKQRGILLMGAKSKDDLILADRYADANYDVQLATNDGSVGREGFVTLLLEELLQKKEQKKYFFYVCGPHPMLIAVTKILNKYSMSGEVSVDHVMCCGVGACFACVVKVNSDDENKWRYARSCSEGPVFSLSDVYVGE